MFVNLCFPGSAFHLADFSWKCHVSNKQERDPELVSDVVNVVLLMYLSGISPSTLRLILLTHGIFCSE